MIRLKLAAALLSLPALLSATDLSPWLTRDFEVQSRATALFQHYDDVESPDGDIDRTSDDQFYTFSAGGAACLPYGDNWDLICGIAAELEMTVANTRKQHPAIDNFRLTARYRILDDVADDDFVTLTPGLTVTQAFKHSLHDISSFHHGQIEGEFTLAVGKEFPYEEYWSVRTWGVFGVGMGDEGSAWFRGDAYLEKNWIDQHQLRLWMHSLWGLGHNNIHHVEDFDGYGPIGHQSVDVGLRYTYIFCNFNTISFEYGRRVYARNFPNQANLFLISFLYPFGI